MKLTQHGQHLWQLTRMGMFNCYLVREDQALTLIDTNMSGSASAIVQAAQSIGLPITRITVTHAHADHAGSLDALAAKLPDAEVAVSARTAQFLQGNRALQADEAQQKLRGSYVKQKVTPARLLAHGEVWGSLQVIAAPGHTPDQIAFYDQRDGSLIAGDAFQTQGGTAVAGMMRWRFPFPAMATWHLPTAHRTAQALQALKPARLAVGHGPVLENPAPAMQAAIAAAEVEAHE